MAAGREDSPGERWLTLAEAARELDTTAEALRRRAKRGTLPSEKRADGRLYVRLDDGLHGDHTEGTREPTHGELVEALRSENAYLRERLTEADARDRENRRLIAAALERLPELEGHERGDSGAWSAGDGPERGTAQPGSTEKRENLGEEAWSHESRGGAASRPWWRRLFGG